MKKEPHFYFIFLISYLMVFLSIFFAETSSALSTEAISPLAKQKSPPVEISPMADKHIFSPEPDSLELKSVNRQNGTVNVGKADDPQQSIDTLFQKVKADIELTGIVITPASRKAMIRYKGKGAKVQTSEMYSSGTPIYDYVLKEISPNYVVIGQSNLEVKLELFKERSDRPETPKEAEPQNSATQPLNGQKIPDNKAMSNSEEHPSDGKRAMPGGNPPKIIKQDPRNTQDGNAADGSNPFAQALQGSGEEAVPSFNNSGTDGNSNMGNPFLQAIQRARERQKSQ